MTNDQYAYFTQVSVNTTILSSTLLLTVLLAVGLFFFIRASVKARIEQVKLLAELPEETLLTQLQQYFDSRSYRLVSVDAATNQVTFSGFVRQSLFLAIFLTLLAACGLFCLALVLSLLYPTLGSIFLALVLLAPAAGIFYWQKAGRIEQVVLKVEPLAESKKGTLCSIAVRAHRDELAALQQALPFRLID